MQKKPYIVFRSADNTGMFAVLHDVLSLAEAYEAGTIEGFRLNFQENGLYYDRSYGANWWNYYFKPLKVGHKSPAEAPLVLETTYKILPNPEYASMTRERAHELILKYFHLQPSIENKINTFVSQKLNGQYVIGIHYRGTDKISEAPRTEYSKVANEVNKALLSAKTENYRLFIATDETAFLTYMQGLFGDRVIYWEGSPRSNDGTPIHLDNRINKHTIGESALIDSLLLSKTNLLIRTSSNLSRWSMYFNPHLETIELSQRH